MQIVLLLIFISLSALAHQTSLTAGGQELFWYNSNVPIMIKNNTADMSSANVQSIIQSSMDQWNLNTSAKISLVSSSPNEIRFVSNFPYGSGVIGITEISYNNSGAIQKAVISLNDDYFLRSFEGLFGFNQVFLGDVVTHEIGHLFGLSHSEVLNSTMFYANFPGQNTVALDDKSGIRQKYDSGYGSISGQMKGGHNVGVLGVHVQAISRKTGEASAAISDENGNFFLGGLDINDTYYLYTSPIKKSESLPGYFSNLQDEFCPASYVGSFYSSCGRELDGKPNGINLTTANPTIDVGTVSINCSLRSDESYSVQKLQSSFNPITIYNYATDEKYEKSFVGWFRKTSTIAWSLSDLLKIDLTAFNELSGNSKYLKISLVSYPFGNQLEYEMDVKKNGSLVPAASRSLIGPQTNDTYNTDFESFIYLGTTPALNDFEIDLRSQKLTTSLVAQTYPAYLEFSTDQYMPYLLIASIWELTPQGLQPLMDSQAILSDNESCLDAPFTYAVSQALEKNDESSSGSDQTAAVAGCGSIEPPKSGSSSSLPLLAAGFLLAVLASTIIKSRKKFLS